MADFLLELYVSRTDGEAVSTAAERARDAAEQLTREGRPVRLLRSLFVPEEETCFQLYEAVSADDVREAARRALLPCERVVETIVEPGAAR
jgi:hypothetical protein